MGIQVPLTAGEEMKEFWGGFASAYSPGFYGVQTFSYARFTFL